MATILELLGALNTKEVATPTVDLASELKSTKEGTLKQLTREKEKGDVSGSSQGGWLITDRGREELEKGEIHSSMIDEGVTPRQQFEAKGRLIGIAEDRIRLATDIVWSGDFNDIIWVWEALGQAAIADDLRSVWANAWRAKLHKSIPPELETELTGVSKAVAEAGEGVAPGKPGGRDYIIIDDEPVRVGENLGDYSLQDAKDVMAVRALRNRFSGVGQPGAASQPGATEKVSDLLTALSPYLNKGGDDGTLRELISTQMELQKQEILSHIPQPGQPTQPKSFIEQITGAIAALSSLKEAGPMLRSILGVPESPGNPLTPTQIIGLDGQPAVLDLTNAIDLRKFLAAEKREDERHSNLMGMAQAVRENVGTFAEAAKEAVAEAREERKGQAPGQGQPEGLHMFKCGNCQKEFAIRPEDWSRLVSGELSGIPCPHCQSEYTREQLMS